MGGGGFIISLGLGIFYTRIRIRNHQYSVGSLTGFSALSAALLRVQHPLLGVQMLLFRHRLIEEAPVCKLRGQPRNWNTPPIVDL